MQGRPEVVEHDGVTAVVFGPELKNITEDRLALISEAMVVAAEADPPRVALDLKNVEFFSSSFIEVIFRLWNRLNAQEDGRLVLCGLTEYCREVLEVTNLDDLWKIFPDLDSGVAAIRPG